MRLIVATANLDKFREIVQIIKDLPFTVHSLKDIPEKVIIREGKKSLSENAKKKALAVSRFYPEDLVIGEDSGLEVGILRGKPGVCSARFAGRNATSDMNNEKLLFLLRKIPQRQRNAQFVTVIALAHKKKVLKYFIGVIRGRITDRKAGTKGFGYDPVFFVPGYGKTFGQIPATTKNKISHRARAFRRCGVFLKKIAAQSKKGGFLNEFS